MQVARQGSLHRNLCCTERARGRPPRPDSRHTERAERTVPPGRLLTGPRHPAPISPKQPPCRRIRAPQRQPRPDSRHTEQKTQDPMRRARQSSLLCRKRFCTARAPQRQPRPDPRHTERVERTVPPGRLLTGPRHPAPISPKQPPCYRIRTPREQPRLDPRHMEQKMQDPVRRARHTGYMHLPHSQEQAHVFVSSSPSCALCLPPIAAGGSGGSGPPQKPHTKGGSAACSTTVRESCRPGSQNRRKAPAAGGQKTADTPSHSAGSRLLLPRPPGFSSGRRGGRGAIHRIIRGSAGNRRGG